jgi:Tol biopolymer transport system component
MTADGTSVNALTSNGANNFTPYPSPNDRLLAFASDMNGQMDLYLLNLENGDLTQLTNESGQDWLPAWSPDGTRLAFISNRSGNDDVFMFDFTAGVIDAPLIQLTTDGGIDTRVNWYNRNMIVWETNRGGNFDLYSGVIENDELTHIRQLTVAPENDFGRPAFSPKGDRMAFGTLRFGSSQIVITDIVMPFSQTLDRNDNNQIDDDEVVQAIQLWAAGALVSGFDRPLSDDLMLRLIDLWARATPIDTVL